jgi:hypothetical protein
MDVDVDSTMTGRLVSVTCRLVSVTGRLVSVTGRLVSVTGRLVSPPSPPPPVCVCGRLVPDGRHRHTRHSFQVGNQSENRENEAVSLRLCVSEEMTTTPIRRLPMNWKWDKAPEIPGAGQHEHGKILRPKTRIAPNNLNGL